MQLKINKHDDIIFEWIPYKFFDIKENIECGSAIAMWNNGPLIYKEKKGMINESHKKVGLRYLHNLQDINNEFLNEVESYLTKKQVFGISQNPDTKIYILVFDVEYFRFYCEKCNNKYENRWCKQCQINQLKNYFTNWTSGSEKIDNLIQKIQLKINNYNDTIFEWIPYNKLIDVSEIGKGIFATAIWKDGPLYYSKMRGEYRRDLNKKVLLKHLYNSENVNYIILNEIVNSIKEGYGISQYPNTKDFILVLQLKYYCVNCGKKYSNKFEIDNKSCTLCQINHENKKISDLIHEMEINIDYNYESNMKFEWIPYDQFNNIEEIGKGGFSTVYSATWKDGLLEYNSRQGWNRISNTKVALKCIYNSQNCLDKFINEVKVYSKQKINNILKIYGISQDPITKDYIMVLEYAVGGNFNSYLEKNYENLNWAKRIDILNNIIEGLDRIHQKHMVHRDFHVGNILITTYGNACISDMGLCKKIDDIDEKNIYGVMPYVAPEVLKGNPYTQAADIYSFGMIMYFVATGRQPFADCAHDEILALNIFNGIRPEINDQIAPKCYIDLMKKCWDSNSDNRPKSNEVKESIELYYNSLHYCWNEERYNIRDQFKKLPCSKAKQLTNNTQAIYTSRLLNPFTKNLSKYSVDNNTVEVTDFTMLYD
ncbi:hypothetical protein RclHR1_20980005 [Rhizophagus clarus]|uniref:Protein kinase domain-containing protein n=1 Tax=Rhizophagus clarus TaxID=94130 RepID=A0A2Z6RKZ4_9GLOM|nr:hypothetical protein RclHR1_20980005 [Rhizophagus clarus]